MTVPTGASSTSQWARSSSPPSRPPGRASLRGRITRLVAVAVGVAVALVSLAAYLTVRGQLFGQLDANLLGRAEAAVDSPLADPGILITVPSEALGAGDVSVALLRADGRQWFALGGRPLPAGAAELAVAAGRAQQSVRAANGQRVAAVPVQPGLALVLAQSTEPTERTLRALGAVLLLVGLVGVAGAAVAGLAVARAAVRPVEHLTAAAENVARTEALDPIEVAGDDELARLAVAFNAMLGALDEARARERRLVADAGHELRTPLTSLRTNLDLLAQSDTAAPGAHLPADVREALLADVRAQLHELSGLVDDLVELSREDRPASRLEPVDLSALVERTVERVRRRATSVSYDVRLSPWTVLGDEPALERAVANLLDNAAKWSPPNATVSVVLRDGVLEITDQGPGIAEHDLPHVFERFYRSAEARSMPGSGLGLAIVSQTARRHGATVVAGRAPGGGARFELRVPGTPDGRVAQ